MSVIPSLTRTELSRFGHSFSTRFVLFAVALVPLLYSGALTSANYDPINRLHDVPAAVVNEDAPVTVTGADGKQSTVALGRLVTANLITSDARNNFDWTITDATKAKQGLEDGTYQAVLTLPKNFSADASSVGSDDVAKAVRATMTITTNDAANYIAGNIAKSVVNTVTDSTSQRVSQNYLTGVYSGFNRVHSSVLQAAQGSGQLDAGSTKVTGAAKQVSAGASAAANGANKLDSGLGTLAAGLSSLSTGAGTLASNTRNLPSQASELAAGATKLSTGSASLSEGAAQVASGSAQLSGGASHLAQGSQALNSGIGQLDSGLGQLKAQTDALPTQTKRLAGGAGSVSSGARDLNTSLGTLEAGAKGANQAAGAYVAAINQLAQQCAASGAAPAFCAQLTAAAGQGTGLTGATGAVAQGATGATVGAGRLADGAAAVATGAGQAATKSEQLVGAIAALNTGSGQLASSSSTLAAGAGSLSAHSKKLSAGAASVSAGSDEVSQGAAAVAAGNRTSAAKAPALAAGAHELASGAAKVNAGTQAAASGAGDLASGNEKLAAGASGLYKGSGEVTSGLGVLTDKLDAGATKVPTYSGSEKEHLSEVASAPVQATDERIHGVGTYGAGLAPYFMGLALWVGAMSVYLILRALPARAIASNAPAWRIALAGYLPGVVMSVLQSAAMVAVIRAIVDVKPANLAGMFFVALFASLAFMAVNQALVAIAGARGRFVALILLVLQVASAGGTYPIQTAGWLWRALHPWLPLSYVVQSFRSMIAGGSLGLGIGWAVMGLWLVIGLALTFMAAKKKRMWTVERLHPSLSI